MESDDNEPEREPLEFTLKPDGLPDEMMEVMQQIKMLAEKMLYHWKRFPIVLPTTIAHAEICEPAGNKDVFSFKDLFIAPTFDELDQVARDSKGQTKKLSAKQLENIRNMGEFEVDSVHFPGQVHRWRLSLLLQKGIQRSQETLLNDAALSLRLLIITAKNRFHSHFFSLSQALKAICTGLLQLLDILVGMPSTATGDLSEQIQQEHTRFLVAELDVQPNSRRNWTAYCDYVKDKSRELKVDKNKTEELKPLPVAYRFQTPKSSDIDLRLFNRDLWQKCGPILKAILERESKGWHVKYKDKIIAELKGQNLSQKDITEHVNNAIFEEYLRRVYDAVLHNEDLESLQHKLGERLVEEAKTHLIMTKAIDNIKVKYNRLREEHKELLIKTCPVKSRITAWMNERYNEFMKDFISQNQWAPHDEAIIECRNQGLSQAVYFLHRDLLFMRDREPVLRKELSKVRKATRVFTFSSRIWFPRNWIVRRTLYGESQVIPTVIVEQEATVTTGRSGPDEPQFSLQKNVYRKTSTRYPFWRWHNYLQRTFSWTWNAIFWLGIVIPWCSPISLRALFFVKPFMPDLELNQGTLCPKRSSLTHTLISRLVLLWRHVRDSRERFEAEPDTGFLGKSLTRQFNRVWNYVIKGALGSTGLVLTFTPACLLSSLMSVIAAITAVAWMPVVTLVAHLGAVLIYDFDHQNSRNAIMYLFEALLFRLVIQGCLQPVGALLAAIIACPLASVAVIVVGLLKRGCRAVWDAFMFHAVIKKRGRVPSSDSFIARRITGPGLASNYFYQIRPVQALAAVESRMEMHELRAWRDNMVRAIEQPKHDYGNFIKQCFAPFSASLSSKGVYEELERETDQLLSHLHDTVDERRSCLNTGLTSDIQSRIKLTTRELKVVVSQTTKMLEGFYPDHVLKRLPQPEEEFWESRHLEEGDWQGLATQVLTEIFSSSFLTPLEETDTCFRLEVEHLKLSRYIEMLKSAEFRDDLDVVSTVHTPKGDIDVEAPYLQTFVFSPLRQDVKYADYLSPSHRKRGRRWPWKKMWFALLDIEKMEVPLPVPNPVVISILIHNRENDQEPIDLEDPVVERIIRVTEALPFVDLQDTYTELHDVDIDVSTPDHTTNSDPEVVPPHLAEPEGAFSEDNANSPSPQSMQDSTEEAAETVVDVGATDESALGDGSRLVYQEREADTSCVLDVDDDDSEREKYHTASRVLPSPASSPDKRADTF